jgi:hypothetical protein
MKIASTLFLFTALVAMLYLNVGQAGELYMGINEAKSEATERLNHEALTILTINDADFASGKAAYINDHEIRYDGHLYDIAATARQGNKVTLQVLHDEKEEGFLSELKEVIEHWGNNTGNNPKQPVAKHIPIIKDYIPASQYTFNSDCTFIFLLLGNYIFPSKSPLIAVLKSPPKLV